MLIVVKITASVMPWSFDIASQFAFAFARHHGVAGVMWVSDDNSMLHHNWHKGEESVSNEDEAFPDQRNPIDHCEWTDSVRHSPIPIKYKRLIKTRVWLSKMKLDKVGGLWSIVLRSLRWKLLITEEDIGQKPIAKRLRVESTNFVEVVSVAFPFGGSRTRIYPS